MVGRRTFLIVQWATMASELLALSCLLHSFLTDYQSQSLPSSETPSLNNNATIIVKNKIHSNCSLLLLPKNQSLGDYKRSIGQSSVIFVSLFFVWWINLLLLLVQFCPHGESSPWIKWINLSNTFVWLIGGGFTLAGYLFQLWKDKRENHALCVVRPSDDDNIQDCVTLLCQAWTSKLVAFGAAFLASWLHLLCFIGTVGLDKKAATEVNRDDEGSVTSSNSIHQSSSMMMAMSSKDLTTNSSHYDSKVYYDAESELDFVNNNSFMSTQRRQRLVRFAEENEDDARNNNVFGMLAVAARIRYAFAAGGNAYRQ